MNTRKTKKTLLSYGLIFLFFLVVLALFAYPTNKVNKLTYDEFMKNLNEGNVTELTVTPKLNAAVYNMEGKLKDYKENETFTIKMPYSDNLISDVMKVASEKHFKVNVKKDPESSSLLTIFVNFFPFLLILGFAGYFLTRQVGLASKSLALGKSKSKRRSDKNKVTFSDVAGLIEEKYEVIALFDFLTSPEGF